MVQSPTFREDRKVQSYGLLPANTGGIAEWLKPMGAVWQIQFTSSAIGVHWVQDSLLSALGREKVCFAENAYSKRSGRNIRDAIQHAAASP